MGDQPKEKRKQMDVQVKQGCGDQPKNKWIYTGKTGVGDQPKERENKWISTGKNRGGGPT